MRYIKFIEFLMQPCRKALHWAILHQATYPDQPQTPLDWQPTTYGDYKVKLDKLSLSVIQKIKYYRATTGGTTGTPKSILIPRARFIKELYFLHGLWKRTGWNYHLRLTIRNATIPSGTFRYRPLRGELVVNGFNLAHEDVDYISSLIQDYEIKFVQGYPSSIAALLGKNSSIFDDVTLFLSSESTEKELRLKLLNQNITYIDYYGHTEKMIMGYNCPQDSDLMHFPRNYGRTTVVKEDDLYQLLASTDYVEPLQVTGYQTDDYVTWFKENLDCKCGFSGPSSSHVLSKRRGTDVSMKFSSGKTVSLAAINPHFPELDQIDFLQFFKEGDRFDVWVTGHLSQENELYLIRFFEKRLPPEAQISVQRQSNPHKLPNGKAPLVIKND